MQRSRYTECMRHLKCVSLVEETPIDVLHAETDGCLSDDVSERPSPSKKPAPKLKPRPKPKPSVKPKPIRRRAPRPKKKQVVDVSTQTHEEPGVLTSLIQKTIKKTLEATNYKLDALQEEVRELRREARQPPVIPWRDCPRTWYKRVATSPQEVYKDPR